MTEEELERLYMDIYDNGIIDYGYKEKFKRYINNRIGKLEKENEELKVENAFCEKACEGATMMYEQLTKAKNIIKNLMIFAEIDNREYEEAYKEAEQFINEVYK